MAGTLVVNLGGKQRRLESDDALTLLFRKIYALSMARRSRIRLVAQVEMNRLAGKCLTAIPHHRA